MVKVIGLIGGIAPPSTIEYYLKLIAGFQDKGRTRHFPSILINSIDMTRMLELVAVEQYDALVDYLSSEIQKLKQGGAEVGALASNTPHIVFDRLKERSSLPLVSIVEAAAVYACKQQCRKLGLFGTKSTMQSRFYQDVFSRQGIQVVTPPSESQDYIHEKYMNELVNGIFLEETKKNMLEIANRMRDENGIEGLVLGGTELPFILKDSDFQNFEVLNTTEIHVRSILDYAMN